MSSGAAAPPAARAAPQPRRPKRGLARILAGVAMVPIVLWAGGFLWFVNDALQPAAPPPVADGIVALTGGADRIETALRLLESNHARLLLVSGVAHDAGLAALARRSGVDATQLANRITLGYRATSTIGNAEEAATWADDNGLRTLIVVTASYHMRRALLEFGRVMPAVALAPCPVSPPALHQGGLHIALLLAAEYTKWLIVRFGPAGVLTG